MDLFDGIVDNKIEENVESTKCALNLASALNVDSDTLVEEALQLRLRYFGHLALCMTSAKGVLEGDRWGKVWEERKGLRSLVTIQQRRKDAAAVFRIASFSVPILNFSPGCESFE